MLNSLCGIFFAACFLADLDFSPPSEARDAIPSKWVLSEVQLSTYWWRIENDNTAHGSLLRLHLFGQWVEQLARIQAPGFDASANMITPRDHEGQRKSIYVHIAPLQPKAVDAINSMRGDKRPFLFTVTHGLTHVRERTIWEGRSTSIPRRCSPPARSIVHSSRAQSARPSKRALPPKVFP